MSSAVECLVLREVIEDVPYHVTQRGNRRQDVFFSDDDRHTYLSWLLDYSQRYSLEILAYCLMTNHIHLVVIPRIADALSSCIGVINTRYSQMINTRFRWSGHLQITERNSMSMSSGFALLTINIDYAYSSFFFLQGFLNSSGLSLKNPGNGRITMLSPEDGTQITAQTSELLDHISSRQELSFQWWFTDSRDLYCHFRFWHAYTYIAFGLDGLNELEYSVVYKSCTTLLRLLIDLRAGIGLVIDRDGVTEDVSWDLAFIDQYQVPFLEPFPNLIAFAKDSCQFNELKHTYSRIKEYNGFYFLENLSEQMYGE